MRTVVPAVFVLLLALAASTGISAQEEVSKGMRITRDIPYRNPAPSDPKRTALDVYRPLEGGELPVMVFIHGGSWRAGDKSWDGSKPGFFTSQGFVFVSVNYRLSPEVQHPVHVQDVAQSLAWVHEHVAEYGGDPERIFVLGHSSGAHLAALVATDERYLREAGADLSVVKGVIVLDGGGYDIPEMVDSGELFSKGRYTRAFGDENSVWMDASPVSHVAAGKGIPPFLLVHAWKRQASKNQAEGLAKALRDAGVRAEVFHHANKNHITINSSIGEDGDETTARIMEFVQSIGATDGGP